ncbi:DnaJ-class molecular chaperone with C-terminal Zn finger domain [Xenococcus sp. PCC 7305]|uniref:J domain-containing protein n=1 Tax=Xenococcus sp. PCC 7305 TaxID=102125 RepID=UPI0002ACD6F2|nr:J domain-containing protein [Xenococcus sp. PCC 7305]ELS03830.1 DnaJ-class molecular chaperone with C-terminal Zn finger domain [Xenococcus sp. PCC 7305]
MTQQRTTRATKNITDASHFVNTYYSILGLHPAASVIEIRRTYRKLSKKYHPDTTEQPLAVAEAKFRQINEAYATLSNPERRSLYDMKIGYSRINVIQAPHGWEFDIDEPQSNSAYLDPIDRPLSAGEIFMLLLLGITFLGCILLVLTVAYLRG